MNQKTKLLKYIEENNIKLIDIFRATMDAEGYSTISYKTIWNIAHGYTEPVLKSMKTIAKVLKVDLDTIF